MRRILALVGILLALCLGAGVAWAEPPLRAADRVTDRAGVLDSASAARVDNAIRQLRDGTGYDLFVVYVRSFDGAGGQDWAERSAELSQLGTGDVLMAVAVDDRAYGVSIAEGFPLSESTTDRILTDDVEPRLAQQDWAGAAIALADGLRTGGSSSGGGSALPWIIGGGAVVAGGAYLATRRRRKSTTSDSATPGQTGPEQQSGPAGQPAPDPYAGVSTQDLAYRSSAALIEVDDAVRTSEQELAAARGHFGDEAVAEFTAALEASRADMLAAFEIRQQLDDDVPEDEPTQRRMHAEILRLASQADQRLDTQVDAFDKLRGLEADAPGYVEQIAARLAAVDARVPAAEQHWTTLQTRYAPSALEPVAANIDQARALIADARTEAEQARADLAKSVPAHAVVDARAAEDALTQAETLLDGLPRREGELADAAARIPAARAEVEQDLAEAGALPGVDPAVVARARAAVAAAAQSASADRPDPLGALSLLAEAGSALDAAIAGAREEQERSRRTAATLDQALVTARSAVSAAEDFVATRRGAVGAQARTRLAEAQRHLQQASAGGDPAVALAEARQAEAMAQQALQLAQQDVSRWSGMSGPGGGRSTGIDLGSMILGGIISGAMRGGGGYGGGYGGRRGGGYGGGGFGGGGFGGGSFGGSATRGRRGGGGRF